MCQDTFLHCRPLLLAFTLFSIYNHSQYSSSFTCTHIIEVATKLQLVQCQNKSTIGHLIVFMDLLAIIFTITCAEEAPSQYVL